MDNPTQMDPQDNKRALTWFLALTFGLSWPLFLAPAVLSDVLPVTWETIAMITWSLAMFMPGVSALVTNTFVMQRELRGLNLGRLGPKRYYLWAWLLPIVLAIAALLFTVLVGTGQIDPDLTMLREGMEVLPEQEMIPVGAILALQIVGSLLFGPIVNTIFALGEELGWRGYLLPKLLPRGTWRAILLSGVIWGVWHAPAIAQGHNYPGEPVLGILMMVILSVLLSAILSWLYLATRSPWAPALAHGSFNAAGALPLLFLEPGFDITWGGTLASPPAWIGMALFIAWLVYTRRLPGRTSQRGDN